jgi:predicted dienelactone hydrolase
MRVAAARFCALAALLPSLPLAAGDGGGGPHSVKTILREWTDSSRGGRQVPVKIYMPANIKAPCPVVIFSHGLGGSRDGYSCWGEHWAEAGYISVHPQHKGSDSAIWKNAAGINQAMTKVLMDPVNTINRPLDISFVLDELEKASRADPDLKGALDLKSVAMAGHSFGAHTTLSMAGMGGVRLGDKADYRDKRISAAIPMSPPAIKRLSAGAVYDSVAIPCLHITGTKDDFPGMLNSPASERRKAYDGISKADQYLVIFKDADHMSFSGRGSQTLSGEAEERLRKQTAEITTRFLDAYLRHDARAKELLLNSQSYLGDNGTFEKKTPEKNKQ